MVAAVGRASKLIFVFGEERVPGNEFRGVPVSCRGGRTVTIRAARASVPFEEGRACPSLRWS